MSSWFEDLNELEDWSDKYQYIAEFGMKSKYLKKDIQEEEYLIKGFQTQVWIKPFYEESGLFFFFYTDSVLIKGLIAMLLDDIQGKNPKEITNQSFLKLESTGLWSAISPNRANGLQEIIRFIKDHLNKKDDVL